MTDATATRNADNLARTTPPPNTYEIDASHTNVGFTVRHMMVSKVRGRFGSFSGSVTIAEDPTESSVNVSIDVASIDTNDANRDGHLTSPDFFNVEVHPTITFASTGVRPNGNHWDVTGDLTVNGITKTVALTVEYEGATIDPYGNLRIGFSAATEINREEFGVSWNQALETGGVIVGKTVTIEIEAEATTPAA